ncbi:hypothetical protein VII00023_20457 [Vibrio ichthyoenteri ATCC 700023]|uniref:Uncharacterized protein n=1 Tax=Vibrio ichthyoenteri ATCC 700023 TaxID=870968 RepID=F9RXM3_9VIBR|nr:NirD/YgiW/YdeI family stress tolerance protein [Vibrio ichthyoenteri]EGU47803.1 hypothetical protein VII00023_20457 [Vibrio ichthyoenteri ATCC 700023]
MKKTIIAIAASLIILPSIVLANDGHGQHQGGVQFNGPVQLTNMTQLIAESNMFTEQHVVVEGKLVRQLSADTFIFNDGSNEVQVELDDDIRLAAPIDASTRVRLYGEFEGGNTPEIEVDRIQVL